MRTEQTDTKNSETSPHGLSRGLSCGHLCWGGGGDTTSGHSPCFLPGVSSISLGVGGLRPRALHRPDGLFFVSPGALHPSPSQTEEELGGTSWGPGLTGDETSHPSPR